MNILNINDLSSSYDLQSCITYHDNHNFVNGMKTLAMCGRLSRLIVKQLLTLIIRGN